MSAKQIVTFHSIKGDDGVTRMLTINEDGTAFNLIPRAFRSNLTEPVDLTGATLTLEDDGSGYRGQRHVIALTIRYADGSEEYQETTKKGIDAREIHRKLSMLISRTQS
jgi:hypothetical protein